jgi:hypothetical protein
MPALLSFIPAAGYSKLLALLRQYILSALSSPLENGWTSDGTKFMSAAELKTVRLKKGQPATTVKSGYSRYSLPE